MINDKEFTAFQNGIFKPYFEKYIEFKRGKGEKVSHSTLIRLKTLNNTLCSHCSTLEISRKTAETILAEKDYETPAARGLRISDLRQFSAFLRFQGINSYEVPAKYMKKVYVPFRPYIFSDNELASITDAADNLEPGQRTQAHRLVYPVIVRILIGTGMRIGEVISLKVKDIDTKNDLITVFESKNNVSRYVPMSESLALIVRQYVTSFRHKDKPEHFLFVSPYTENGYSYSAMRYMFRKIYDTAGIRTPQGRFPRIHDVRHTFCTMSLERMLSAGISLYTASTEKEDK
jgi:integrase